MDELIEIGETYKRQLDALEKGTPELQKLRALAESQVFLR